MDTGPRSVRLGEGRGPPCYYVLVSERKAFAAEPSPGSTWDDKPANPRTTQGCKEMRLRINFRASVWCRGGGQNGG